MEAKPKVLIDSRYFNSPSLKDAEDQVRLFYEELFDVFTEDELAERQEVIPDISGLVVHKLINSIELSTFPGVKVIAKPGAGLDLYEPFFPEMLERGIQVVHTPRLVTHHTADMAMTLLLSCARQIPMLHKNVTELNEHKWIMGRPISGATIGIVGLGRIGTEIAKRALGFNMNILYFSRTRRSADVEISLRATHYSNLLDMLSKCDFVVLACPLTKKTHNLISKIELDAMKNTSILINISRGKVINTEDLIDAVKEGNIWGAGLDVTDPEPLPEKHPLKELDRVVITPHASVAVPGIMLGAHKEVRRGLKAILIDNQPPPPEVTSSISKMLAV